MTLSEIRELLAASPVREILEELSLDPRPGVQKLLLSYERKLEREQKELARLNCMYNYENKLRQEGRRYIAGVDEAGRGPLAGPLVVAAVILPEGRLFYGLNDSKQVKEKLREQLFDEIMEEAVSVSVEIINVEIIDKVNIYQATLTGMEKVLLSLPVRPNCALIDAMPLTKLPFPTISLIHGDSLSASIAAASIVAKVTRDRIMAGLDELYPGYGFLGNKGYGTAQHMEAIAAMGATPAHRKTFEPLKSLLSGGEIFEHSKRGTATE